MELTVRSLSLHALDENQREELSSPFILVPSDRQSAAIVNASTQVKLCQNRYGSPNVSGRASLALLICRAAHKVVS